MDALRKPYSLTHALLLGMVMLAAQSLLLWHTHDAEHTPEASCELCVHAQHHTPAPASNPPQVFAALSVVDVRQPVIYGDPVVNFRFTHANGTRAPPHH